MKVDYHAHTPLCNHAAGQPVEYLERARSLGFDEFGFSEHSYWMVRENEPRKLAPTKEEMGTYLEWMDSLRATYDGTGGKPLLRVGVEADWVPESLDEARAFVASYPFDYVIGSVHHLRSPRTGEYHKVWSFPKEDTEAYYRMYFDAVGELAQSGLCDILAHLDVPVRSRLFPSDGVVGFVQSILPQIVDSGVAVEINTSGMDHFGEFFPSRDVLKLLVENKVPITFGSDAHQPGHVGRYFDEARRVLRDCGATTFQRFEGRRGIATSLEV